MTIDIDGILSQVGDAPAIPRGPAKPRRRVPGVEARAWTLPGFGPMTKITTSLGEVPAQALRERDMVRTRAGDFKPIVWLDRIVLDEEFLSLHPDALPVLIRPGAISQGVPAHPVALAPRQRISAVANRLPPGDTDALSLIGRPNVFRKAEAMYTYTLFHLGTPETIIVSKMFVEIDP